MRKETIDLADRYSTIEICGECLEISANGKRDIDYDILDRYERAQALEGGEPVANLYNEAGDFDYTEFSKSPCGFCRSTMAGSRYPARLTRLRTPSTRDVWELTEKAPRYAEDIASLWSWSLNYDRPTPWMVFLWLIGHEESRDQGMGSLSYFAGDCMGLDYLAHALEEYAERPNECMEYVEAIYQAWG